MTHKETIAKTLKEEILTLKLTPGTVISEMALAERFSLSRTPIRDILKHLAIEGYIDIYPKRGNVVSYIDLESVEQVIYMRSTLEEAIIKSLCGKVTLKSFHDLNALLEQQQQCIDDGTNLHAFITLDDAFHQHIYKLAGHSFVWDALNQFVVHYARYRRLHMLKKEKLLSVLEDHRRICDYLLKGEQEDVDALMHHHLRADVKSKYVLEHFSAYIKQ